MRLGLALLLGSGACATPAQERAARAAVSAPTCANASAELARLGDADQAIRVHPPAVYDGPGLMEADLTRRIRVAELFAAGCLTTASDYGTAALIFQHGTAPEHYLLALVFASRAVELGDASERELVAKAADRYLVNTHRKQLFGSQRLRPPGNPCWCMPSVEMTFPDAQRVAYAGRTLAQQREEARAMNAGGSCPKVDCDEALLPTPRGSLLGVW